MNKLSKKVDLPVSLGDMTLMWYPYSAQAQSLPSESFFVATLHRIISASISRWMTYGPAELPILPGGKCCTLALLNIIPKFPKENTSFCQIYHQNPAYLCVPYVWLLRDRKPLFENFVNQKMAYVTNRLLKDERWQILLLGDYPVALNQVFLLFPTGEWFRSPVT